MNINYILKKYMILTNNNIEKDENKKIYSRFS